MPIGQQFFFVPAEEAAKMPEAGIKREKNKPKEAEKMDESHISME